MSKKKTKKTKKPIKKVKKKKTLKKTVKIKKKVEKKAEKLVGEIAHYYTKIGVAVVNVKSPISIGDTIRIKGATTDFKQKVDSMQIEHRKISKAKKGDVIGLKVKDRTRIGDQVYLI